MTPTALARWCSALFLLAAPHAFADTMTVSIDNFSFTPAEIVVSVGSHVTWTNNDDIPHTVTDASNPRSVRSEPLDSGESYVRAFDTPGAFNYFCSLHPHMQGTVIVR